VVKRLIIDRPHEGKKIMNVPRRTLLTVALAKLGFLSSNAMAATEPVQRPTSAAEVWARTELYFGTSRPGLPEVTDAEFTDFVDTEVTPRFPDGLTRLTGKGQFRGSSGLIKETSHVMILFYPLQMRNANLLIQQIRDRYKARFNQESVLRADGYSIISF
jgi:Protein of unknown function (DUF3574)